MLGLFAFVASAALIHHIPQIASKTAGRRAGVIISTQTIAELQFRQLTPSRPDLPLLLFVPGIDGSGLAGTTQWPRLESSFEVHALSLTPDDRSTFEDLCSCCSQFLATMGDGRGRLLVGESTGAVVALSVAQRSAPLVDGMCLINPATSYSGSLLSSIAPLLPRLPDTLYRTTPLLVTPLFGKPDWFRPIVGDRQADTPCVMISLRGLNLTCPLPSLAFILAPTLAYPLAHWLTCSPGTRRVTTVARARTAFLVPPCSHDRTRLAASAREPTPEPAMRRALLTAPSAAPSAAPSVSCCRAGHLQHRLRSFRRRQRCWRRASR